MGARGDDRMRAAVLEALRARPLDALEIRDALRERTQTLLAGREGLLHPFLHDLVRRGRLEVLGPGARGLRRYARPGQTGGEDSSVRAPTPEPEDERVVRLMAGAVRGSESRARVAEDLAGHRAALRRAGALAAFGSPRQVRHVLRRVDRGRPTVFFPEGVRDRVRKLVLHEVPWILAAAVAFLLLRAYVVEVFVIPSASMVPTLQEGDRVVVFKPGGSDRPERWQIVTFLRHGVTYVKRAVGLGGEHVALLGGDVYIDGELAAKPPELRDALRTPYGEWRFEPRVDETTWSVASGEQGATAISYAGPALWSSGLANGTHPPRDVRLRDVWARLDLERPPGTEAALDLVYVRADPQSAEAVLSVEASDEAVRALVTVQGEVRWIGREVGRAEPGAPLEISYVDGLLQARVGQLVLERPLAPSERPPRGTFVQPRLRGRGDWRPLALRLDRDLHYSERGQLGVPPPQSDDDVETFAFDVPPGMVFFLGDNTHNSNDSRFGTVGTVPQADLIGPVRFRIWPPARLGRVP